jgi:prefoldin subunit 5
MTEDKRVVEARRDVAEAQCQYCDRTFKSPRGRSIHERACKEKEHADERTQSGEGSLIESPPSAVASVSKEAAEISEEFTVPPTDDKEGGLKVDFRMPDARYVSDPSLEIKQLKAQMEKERKRWEDERKKFLQQTEGLLMDGEPYAAEGIPEPKIEKGPDVEEVLLAEMRISAELDDLKNELQRKANHETMKDLVESRQEVTSQIEDLDANVEALTNVLGEVSARTLEDLKALGKKLDMKADEGELKSLRDIIARLDGKLDDVVEVVGYEESLNLSKIPPMILELVYQTTLDDVASALIRILGEMETEKVIQNAMEDVRVRTSGSEMFRYQYPRFKIKGLASSIEKGLVSAKQVQMTYDEILKRLKEHIPQHQAKNFRAMIKVKSQEFAVERSSEIAKELASMQSEVESLRQSISEISQSMSSEISDIASKLSEINSKLKEFEPAVDGKELDDAEGTFEQPSPEIPQETLEGASEESSMEELEKQVLASIPGEGTSLTKLKKLDFRDEDLQSILDSLVQKGLVERTKRGKGFAYFAKEVGDEGGGSDNER